MIAAAIDPEAAILRVSSLSKYTCPDMIPQFMRGSAAIGKADSLSNSKSLAVRGKPRG